QLSPPGDVVEAFAVRPMAHHDTSRSVDQSTTIDIELYRSLRAEEVSYVEKVTALWLQKFTLVGAAIAALFLKDFNSVSNLPGGIVRISAVFAIPVLSALIDAKILEYGLHARTISRFLRRHSTKDSFEAEWERLLWGDDGDRDDLKVVRL